MPRRLLLALLPLAVLAAACSSDADEAAPAADAPTTEDDATTGGIVTDDGAEDAPSTSVAEETTTTTTEPEPQLPASEVTAPITFYAKDAPELLGFDNGDVTAHWYQGADGFRVVVFVGVPQTTIDQGACPGASINTVTFEHVANAPTTPTACDGFLTVAGPPASAYRCAGELAFRTIIPNDQAGALFSSVEVLNEAGDLSGFTGTVDTGAVEPDLDVADCVLLP